MKAIKTEFIEDDDEESEQDEGGEDLEEEQMGYREIKDLIKNTINPTKDIDEFMMFKELLLFLKDNKNEVFFTWENSLNKNRKEQVYKLFGTKRISIQTNNTTIQVPRRIVTIKRFLNNNNNTQ